MNLPLSRALSRYSSIACWDYQQELDEPCCLDTAIILLHDYLKTRRDPVNLIGHGLGGILAQMYAQRYSERVKSLVLLSVSPQPALTWHTHYYVQRKLIPCSRSQLLMHTAKILAGRPLCRFQLKCLSQCLENDLDSSPNPHSLLNISILAECRLTVPTLVCLGGEDPVVDPSVRAIWLDHLRPEDRLWSDPNGSHFFHYFAYQSVAEQILAFWESMNLEKAVRVCV
ncbi:MAG: alpha/beta hydrolase [Synechococcaceae cyanobacterium SM2_3_2]|nr:alpha/beta hydrolase [Synechococcaceae cyanobacterium SM2_3_2]